MREELEPWEYREHLLADGDPLTARSATDAGTVELRELSPIIGVALHHSHRVRQDVRERMTMDEDARLYEEDPFTERFLGRTTHRLTPNQSRYEVDMNRSSHRAVYLTPDMAWGNEIYASRPSRELIEKSNEKWYEFHTLVDAAVQHAIDEFGHAVVLDMHSYNYQRDGDTDWRTDGQPVINLGTRHLQLDDEGEQLKDWFFEQLEATTVLGEEALVEENSVFYGGYLNRRLSRTYGSDCLTLSVEFKKVFMHEQTGQPHPKVLDDLLDQFHGIVGDLGARLGAPTLAEPEPVETVGSYGHKQNA